MSGVELDIYSLRHTFATVARRAGIASDARDRLLGHRAKDTKALHYEDKDLPLLAAEVTKLPATLAPVVKPAAVMKKRGPRKAAPTPSNSPLMVPGKLHASGAQSVSLTISAEEERFELPEGLHPRRFSKPCPPSNDVAERSPLNPAGSG